MKTVYACISPDPHKQGFQNLEDISKQLDEVIQGGKAQGYSPEDVLSVTSVTENGTTIGFILLVKTHE